MILIKSKRVKEIATELKNKNTFVKDVNKYQIDIKEA